MYSLEFSDDAIISIRNFIDSYDNIFIKLFTDTWIDNEKLIIEQYKLISKGIYNKMILSINNSLKPEKVL